MPDETLRSGVSGPAGFSPDSFTIAEPPAMSHAWPPAGGTSSASERIDDGGPAFPGPDGGASVVNHPFGFVQAVPTMQPGMSLRDHLAGQALVGIGTWMPNLPSEAPWFASRD